MCCRLALLSLTPWWNTLAVKDREGQLFHVRKEIKEKKDTLRALSNEPKCWRTEIAAVSYISDLEGVFVCSAIDSTRNVSKRNLSHIKLSKLQRDGSKHLMLSDTQIKIKYVFLFLYSSLFSFVSSLSLWFGLMQMFESGFVCLLRLHFFMQFLSFFRVCPNFWLCLSSNPSCLHINIWCQNLSIKIVSFLIKNVSCSRTLYSLCRGRLVHT